MATTLVTATILVYVIPQWSQSSHNGMISTYQWLNLFYKENNPNNSDFQKDWWYILKGIQKQIIYNIVDPGGYWWPPTKSTWNPPLFLSVGPGGHQYVGSGTYYGQWSCSAPDGQYKVSKSHPSSIPTRSCFHRVLNLDGCDLSLTTHESASWFHRSPKQSTDRLVHWVATHLGLDRWSAWPDSAEEPLRGS